MKKIFYSLIFVFIAVSISAQTPGGIGGSVLWLKANTVSVTSNWPDNSGQGNNFTQGTALNEPLLAANAYNFNPAMHFDGINSFLSQSNPLNFPQNNADRTIIIVANATAGQANGYRWVFKYGNAGTPGATCQMGTHDASLANDFYANDHEWPNYWNAPANIPGAMAEFTLTGGNGFQYDRGNFLQFTPVTGLSGLSTSAYIGALAPGAELWSGSIAEVILFSTALSDAQRIQVESYLALKYGFTLGVPSNLIDYTASDGTTVYWTASNTYQNDIFGIGTDNGTGLTQTQSNSINSGSGDGTGANGLGNLVLSTGTALADKQFLMIGNDAGALTEHTTISGEVPITTVGSVRVLRNWQVQNTGSVGAVDLSFDTTGLTLAGGSTLTNFALMIDQDGDGDYHTGTVTYVRPTSATGNKLNFPGITLNNNVVFTLITQASALLPAIWQGFTATVQKNVATLTWKTSNEVNVDHYTVEYSVNGVAYLPATTVAAKNGAGINTYTVTQANLPAGIRYYRIRRVDKDGQSQLSEIKSVRAGGLTTVVLKTNPIVKGRIELIIDVPQNQQAVIRVLSVTGKILVQQNAGLAGGTNTVNTNLTHVAAGTYFVQVQLADDVINKKFVKL